MVWINPNHYTTTDSQYYLESATNILRGNGYTILEDGVYAWNGTFPPGYPVTIGILSFLTKIDMLLASKLINITASGVFIFYINRHLNQDKTLGLFSVLFLGSFLKLWAHTWSEPLFLIVLFVWTHQIQLLSSSGEKKSGYAGILGMLLISLRYAGIFIIPLTILRCIIQLRKNNHKTAAQLALLCCIWILTFSALLLVNRYKSGLWYGGERLGGPITIGSNISVFCKGLLYELMPVSKSFSGPVNIVVVVLQTIILILIGIILYHQKCLKIQTLPFKTHCLSTALAYLIFLFLARTLSPFDEPWYRLLSPFSFLVFCGVIFSVDTTRLPQNIRYLWLIWIFLSWVKVLPSGHFPRKINMHKEPTSLFRAF